MNPGDSLVCDIYTIPTPTPSGITIVKYVCDQVTSALPDVEKMSALQLRDVCLTDPTPYNIEFQISDTMGASEYEIVGAEIPGAVRFDAYTPGQVTIYESIPQGFMPPQVYCGVVPPGTNQPGSLTQVKVLGSFIVLGAPSSDEIQCEWFNLETANGSVTGAKDSLDPNKPVLRAGKPQLNVFPRGCPEGFNPIGKTFVAFHDACTVLQNGVAFSLTGASGYSSIEITSNASAGAVLFYDLADGQYSFTEMFPAGYGSAYVFCGTTIQVDQAPTPLASTSDQPDRGSYSFAFVQNPNQDIIVNCQVFNISRIAISDTLDPNKPPLSLDPVKLPGTSDTLDPTDRSTSSLLEPRISVQTYSCPDGVSSAGTLLNDFSICVQRQTGIAVSLYGPGSYVQMGTTGNPNPLDVEFVRVPAGRLTVREVLPAGFGSAVIGCGGMNGIRGEEPAHPMKLAPAGDLTYSFDYDPDATIPIYFCIIFNVDDPLSSDTSGPADDSLPSLDPVKLPGTSDTLDPNKPPLSLDPVRLPTSIPVPGLPIHVIFRNCPATFDPAGKVIGDFWTACKEIATVTGLTLTLPDGSVQQGSVSVSGYTVDFATPPVGQLTFSASLPSGYASVYIGCDITSFIQTDPPIERFVAAPPDGVTYTFDYDLGPNRYTDCQMFNVPAESAAAPVENGVADLAASGGVVDIYTWSCAVDYDTGNATFDNLVADCTTVMSNIRFSLSTIDGEVASGTTGVDGPGMASFAGISGDVSVVEKLPAGYGTPIVYCGSGSGEVVDVSVTEGSAFVFTVIESEKWTCDVFNTRIAP